MCRLVKSNLAKLLTFMLRFIAEAFLLPLFILIDMSLVGFFTRWLIRLLVGFGWHLMFSLLVDERNEEFDEEVLGLLLGLVEGFLVLFCIKIEDEVFFIVGFRGG